MSSPNLSIAHIATAQTQKETTANSAFDSLDTAQTETFSVNVAAGGTITPTPSDIYLAFTVKATGALASSVNLIFPTNKKFYRVHHAGTGHTLTAKCSGQTGVTLNPGDIRLLYCNGTDIVQGDSYAAGAEQTANRNGTYPTWVAAPATATSAGIAGQLAQDGAYLYICVATNVWVRTAISTF